MCPGRKCVVRTLELFNTLESKKPCSQIPLTGGNIEEGNCSQFQRASVSGVKGHRFESWWGQWWWRPYQIFHEVLSFGCGDLRRQGPKISEVTRLYLEKCFWGAVEDDGCGVLKSLAVKRKTSANTRCFFKWQWEPRATPLQKRGHLRQKQQQCLGLKNRRSRGLVA